MDVTFCGYALDCLALGTLALPGGRLADHLADCDTVEVTDLFVRSLPDGRELRLDGLALELDDLAFLAANGPRGEPDLRVPGLRRHPAAARIGPYEVAGYLHAPAFSDPFAANRHRRLVPLTEAVVRVTVAGRQEAFLHGTLLVLGTWAPALHSVGDDALERLREAVVAGRPAGVPALAR